ncbi:glycoside hydrolase N-terminal domain-containing protein [Microbacterium sp. MPKO10]|uniref:glycosyl hydrolase family 95 catalytic domain-containing protein n=1 Tax=Microbacterium sp. MPKO10 TaxID=2989818 RepID=UPI0022356976|nr:glycoside hydrolase N-terminal domain-containing protein [Microbacterium sp. MPKO10]MCW4457108.1 glycoside hydrolase N-terminal domain-containing protein [Microbacterium sp. MPKO10]
MLDEMQPTGSFDAIAGGAPFESRTVALKWEDGLIAGSGTVGALLFGEPGEQTISLSHEQFFLPANPTPDAPDLSAAVASIRDAVNHGDSGLATELMMAAAREPAYGNGLVWTNPLGMCATLLVRAPGSRGGPVQRLIDLEHGEVATQWQDARAGTVRVSVIAPRGGETVWVSIEAEHELSARIDLGLSFEAVSSAATGAPNYSEHVRSELIAGPSARIVASAVNSGSAITATTRVHAPNPWAFDDTGTHLTTVVDVPENGRVLLAATVAVGDDAGALADFVDVRDWASLRQAQSESHGELVRQSVLDFGDEYPAELTELTWRRAREGDAAARRRAVEIAYLSGRANVIGATGFLPPTLQGVWQGTWTPAWSADYTMNGNVQNGGAASLIPTGTPELATSLLRLVLPHLQDYRTNARKIFGANGMLLPARMSDTGRANHFGAEFPHVFWVGGGGWILRFAADIVSTTGDRSIVDDDLWALVTGVLEFAESASIVTEGVRHLAPGYSPENTPGSSDFPLAADPTMDIAILRDAARCARVLAEARGDDSLNERWSRVVADLPDYRVAADGTLAEWIDGALSENIAHRHTSQLYPLWYEPDEAFVGDSELARALRNAAATTIRRKIAWRADDPTAPPGRMEMAFGLVQLGLAAAALGDAESTLTCIDWLALEHWTPALTTTHDAGRIFNLDPSGGLPALVAAMLVSSDRESLTVVPALPDEWSEQGAITGLTARGGIIVDRLEWNESEARVHVRRRTDAEWLRPDGSLRLTAGSSFLFSESGTNELLITVGENPVVVALHRVRHRA